jgi:hypothetical protein
VCLPSQHIYISSKLTCLMKMHFISVNDSLKFSLFPLCISRNLCKAVLVETAALQGPLSYEGKTSQKHLCCRRRSCQKYNRNIYVVKTVFPKGNYLHTGILACIISAHAFSLPFPSHNFPSLLTLGSGRTGAPLHTFFSSPELVFFRRQRRQLGLSGT